MTDSGETKLNGSSGFISFDDEDSFTRSFTRTEVVLDCAIQNEANHRLASLRKRRGQTETRTPDASKVRDVQAASTPRTRDEAVSQMSPEQLAQAERVVNFYRRHGDFWNTFPKTDFTYSRFSRWYGDEVAPGIPRIPNMCRRSYRSHGGDSAANSPLSTPLSSSGSGNGLGTISGIEPLISSTEEEETVYRRIKRVVRVTTVTVFTKFYRNLVRPVTGNLTVGGANDGSQRPELTDGPYKKWLLWLLLLFLLGLLYLLWFGCDYPSEIVDVYPALTYGYSAFCNFLGTASRPIWAFYDFLWYFVTLFFNTVLLIPSFLVAGNQTTVETLGFTQSQMSWLMDTIRSVVESMDPHDFRVSPEEEDRLVERVSEGLRGELSGLSSNQKMTTDQIERIHQRLAEFEEKLRSVRVALREKLEVGTKLDVPDDFRFSVISIVEELIEKYHADRTGKTDYALLSNGGAIASIRCTRPYKERAGEYVLWDFFNWEFVNSPEIILKPSIMPGECWAFEGANGYLAIRLSLPIYVEGFTMEHTPKELSPFGHIKSAPRKFSVWGLESLHDSEDTFLGRFEFLESGKSLQSFEAVVVDRPFQLVELRIESNHGHLEYTCLYRFRVHGRPL